MFLRSVEAAHGRHEYLRLVENFRQGEKTRQRVVLHIGRKDLLALHLDALVRLLQADQSDPAWVSREQISAPQSQNPPSCFQRVTGAKRKHALLLLLAREGHFGGWNLGAE